ncbi:AraC family transcriptional regulator [Ohtaekwangia koreensis]|uniref:AraC-type DNA-binding protein n=1 Tax=Ohtaekwangia koreensis TaxID=688867 RepID=A0A1T5ML50_9BACT|nr:AraC family transcriptional regulator [Ohtaekwangia koreensis]SKC88638.1 AraC-type DNA-binding protein [Ohtaekwangia koreensis]
MKTQTLSYRDVATFFQQTSVADSPGLMKRVSGKQPWGTLEEKILSGDHYRFMEYAVCPVGNFRMQYQEEQMPNSINICIALQGEVGVTLKESGMSAVLTGLRHHSMYAYEQEYDLIVRKNIHGIHIALDREYYANLLCDNDRWTASLKEKLLRREFVMHGDAVLENEMQQVIRTISNNTLSGNLRKLLIEAKILELVALQISQFMAVEKARGNIPKLKRNDIDTFHDLRIYLDSHFTEDTSLSSLSRMFALNEFKLKKGFKDLFQSTVFDYIYDLRMNHAHHLLMDQRKFVNEVASEVGYKNPNHFSTAFKRKFGVCPSDI